MPEAAAHELQRTVDEITGYSRRTRKLVWWLAALGAVALALGVVVTVLAISTSNQAAALSRTTTDLHSAQLSNCALSNSIKARETALWHTLFTLASEGAPGKPSAETQKLTAEFLGDVDNTFTQVNCAKAYPGG
jgi:hypothetical protein